MNTATPPNAMIDNLPTLPPHSIEAEAGALGCVLLTEHQAEADALLHQLLPNLFYDNRHQVLVRELHQLRQDGHAVAMPVVHDWIRGRGKLDQVGGAEYLFSVPDRTPSVAMFSAWVGILKENALRRWAISKASRLEHHARAKDISLKEIKDDLAEMLERTETAAGGRKLVELLTLQQARDFVPDPRTFIIGQGLVAMGEWSVLAGWPGLGKSRLLTTLAVAGAKGSGSWMGYEIRRPFKTLIIQSQNSVWRIKSEVAHLPPEAGAWIQWTKPHAMNFSRPDYRAELRRVVEQWRPDVIGLDPWNVIARDEGQSDYLEAIENVKSVVDSADHTPAVVVVAHLRKQRGGDSWRPKTGRAMLDELSGSFALGAEARTVFVVQPASLEMTDDRVIFDCAKSNNDQPLPMSAWHRRNGEFVACSDFDFDSWLSPTEDDNRRQITEADLAAIFNEKDGLTHTRTEAVKLLRARGFSQATAYRATDLLAGRFKDNLTTTQNGRIAWRGTSTV
jgi:hypothetical protein